MRITDVRVNGMKNPVGFQLPDLRCSWILQGTAEEDVVSTSIEVAADEQFQHIVSVTKGTALNPAGARLEMELSPRTQYWLRIKALTKDSCAISETAFFETGKAYEPWLAQWITPEKEDTFHPRFETHFRTTQVQKARLYISGLGLYVVRLNRHPVTEEFLTPYYSDYHAVCQVQTYDVTDFLRDENFLEISLGNGWYKGRFGLGNRRENFGNRFQMIAELRISRTDGTEQIIVSDSSWYYNGSDVIESDIYDGETLDRCFWQKRDNPLKRACITSYSGKLVDRYSLPVKPQETMPVRKVIHTRNGETVLDFGQNFTGYVAFHSRLNPQVKVILDFGEILQNGNFYNENYRSAKSRFTYVSDGREEWVRPYFTFFGFRYVRVSGWQGEINPEDFVGYAVYSTMEQTGWIETGHDGINRLFSNTMWGQKSNSVDFPTDCPQRDERLGWTGDAQVFAGTASYNMDTTAFYDKFLYDLRMEQKKLDGILPGVIPVFDASSAIYSSVWGDLATILPTILYWHSGDITILKRWYPMMKDWVDRIDRDDKARGHRYLFDFGDQLGDWLALDGRNSQSSEGATDPYFIASCYYANSIRLTCKAAKALGIEEDTKQYQRLYGQVRDSILWEYFTPSGRLSIDTQTAYLVALAFHIWIDEKILVRDLRKRFHQDSYRLTGGFVGAPIMCKVLAEHGMEEEAWYFLLQRDYPGWMHCIDLGATTIWERWNSVLDNGLLSGTMMNSLNHYAYGAVTEFLYRDAGGLIPTKPGFQCVKIHPKPNPRLKFLRLRYKSVFGTYRVEWKLKEDGRFDMTVSVPYGCMAQLVLPWNDQKDPISLTVGTYQYHYQANLSVWAFGRNTPLKELANRPDQLAKIGTISPRLRRKLEAGDPEMLCETIDTLKHLPQYMGFTEDVQNQLFDVLSECYKPYEIQNDSEGE